MRPLKASWTSAPAGGGGAVGSGHLHLSNLHCRKNVFTTKERNAHASSFDDQGSMLPLNSQNIRGKKRVTGVVCTT